MSITVFLINVYTGSEGTQLTDVHVRVRRSCGRTRDGVDLSSYTLTFLDSQILSREDKWFRVMVVVPFESHPQVDAISCSCFFVTCLSVIHACVQIVM